MSKRQHVHSLRLLGRVSVAEPARQPCRALRAAVDPDHWRC
ncbi:hypothetical protein [Azospirillum palustre]